MKLSFLGVRIILTPPGMIRIILGCSGISDDANFRTFLETDCSVDTATGQELPDYGNEPPAIFEGNELPEAEEICRKWVASHFQ